MAHKGHPDCPHTSKAKCEKARREAIGPCVSMLSEDQQCPHLGTDTVDGRAYCGQHVGTIYRTADEARRSARRKQAMDDRIDTALAFHASHPSVWDRMSETVPTYDPLDVWWYGESGIGVHVPTGLFVVDQDGEIIEWEGPYQ